ncbi:ATP-binding cassette domain-containing protein [Oscillatoria amoena NRMC-F 0135]|nr:ATP-binding cassette domain-containing protein [Oscillatoria amoena NRMC-F 0135]
MEAPKVVSISNANIFQHNNSLVLHDLNLEVGAGEFVYLIGKTGSGKSSLLKTLYADLPLKEGSITVAGIDLDNISRKKVSQLRRKLGIVFQDFQLLYDRTVFDNLDFVLRSTGWAETDRRKNRVAEVLKQVGLATKEHKMPHELSGGEQQRVVIARALLNNPELIIADEPTGNLDPEVADDIMAVLKQINAEGTAVIMATHDYRLINKFYGKVYRCEGGKVFASTVS